MNAIKQPVREVRESSTPLSTPRLKSQDLMHQARAIQIEHDGKIYELRVTRLNKLILTA